MIFIDLRFIISFLIFEILATDVFFVYNFHHREHKEKNIEFM